MASGRALPLLLLCALCAVWGASAEANSTTTPTPTPTAMEKGSKWGLVVVCVCGGILVIAGGVYAYSELKECCSTPAPPAVRGVKKEKEDHGHSHDGKKKEKKDKEHGHSHDGKEKKEKKEKHGHSHDGKKKESKDKKQDAEKQSLLGAHGASSPHSMHRNLSPYSVPGDEDDDDDHGHSHV